LKQISFCVEAWVFEGCEFRIERSELGIVRGQLRREARKGRGSGDGANEFRSCVIAKFNF
jgi:hypothetical protein